MSKNQHWQQRDLNVLWHPCTQMKDHESIPLVPIKRGEGAWLYDFDGNRYLDVISSWWVNIFGHANPDINQRIKDQLDQLEHVILAGFSHQPAIELSERLRAITPTGLTRVFYADNGSSGVEVALKMSHHYWRNCGQPEKADFITVANSYHGETLGTLSVGDVGLYKDTYAPLLRNAAVAPSPAYDFDTECGQQKAQQALEGMRAILQEKSGTTAAVIVEPLVQCAAGMLMHHPDYIRGLRALCDEFNVHLIADEIAVGFGRTGTLFACEQADISPDFICLSKGLTAGYLPLAAILTRENIYNAFYDDYATMRAFLHSHSFTGNPLACSAALASLDLFQEQNVLERNQQSQRLMDQHLAELAKLPGVRNVRRTGMIAAMDLVQMNGQPFPSGERRGIRAYQYALEHELLLRPLGNSIYWMPPYILDAEDYQHIADVTRQAIEHAVA
ncbi:MAG TPA: adenosylmethionine--8-amino-7-oxononanoate transaminase [Halothiobacillaceae bacterium]|nr:adenosylmethionine--8-amino-7-oxononanoate transaminase [Halothiobacillaceae bacterium]